METYLKDKLPKIEPTIPISTFGSVNLDDLMDSIKKLKKVPTSDELLRENKKLRNQLQEKGKIIDEAIKYIKKQISFYDDGEYSGYECNCDGFKLWEILERGKNGI